MYRLISNSKMPRFLKLLLNVLLTLTCIYWIGLFTYKILEFIRVLFHWISDKRNWWTFLMCIFILLVGALLIAQFKLGLNPFGKFSDWICEIVNNFRKWAGNLIGGE